MDCPFCDPEPERTLTNGERAFVLFSDPRLMPGHLLVIPRRHVQRLSELTPGEREELFALTIEHHERILRFATGCDVRQNYRPFLKQSRLKVDHLHIHLLPRELNDELYRECMVHEEKVFADLSAIELAAMHGRLTRGP